MHYLSNSNKLSIDRETTMLSLLTLSPKLDHLLLEVGRGTWLTAKLVEEWLTRNHWKVFGSKLFQYKVYILLLLPKFLSGILLAGEEKWLIFFAKVVPLFPLFSESHSLPKTFTHMALSHIFLNLRINKKKGGISSEALFHWEDKNLVNIWPDECKFMQIYLSVGIFTRNGIFLRKNGGFWIWRDSAK